MKTSEPEMVNLHFCGKLSRIFSKQLRTGSVLLNLGMQSVYIIG